MSDVAFLCATASAVGVVHTLAGPDHYLPFAVLARARGWSAARAAWVTVLCGLGHVGSSVGLGLLGLWAGIGLERLAGGESVRGRVASWGLLIFGLVYGLWGLKHTLRGRRHEHAHSHGSGLHSHLHNHAGDHAHPHDAAEGFRAAPWLLFILFVFGPCEPLIPLVMATWASAGARATAAVSAVFCLATVAAMLGAVFLTLRGFSLLPLPLLQRFAHALAGGAIAACGAGMVWLGL